MPAGRRVVERTVLDVRNEVTAGDRPMTSRSLEPRDRVPPLRLASPEAHGIDRDSGWQRNHHRLVSWCRELQPLLIAEQEADPAIADAVGGDDRRRSDDLAKLDRHVA